MDALRRFLDRFFKTQKTGYEVPFLHETYDFNIYCDEYVLWKGGRVHLALSQIITASYKAFVNKTDYPSQVNFIENGKVAGVAIKTDAYDFNKMDYIYLCTYLKEQLLDSGYIQQLSEIKSKNHASGIRQDIKIYLKPSRKNITNGKNDQLYGNVSMEISSHQEQLSQFKISCSYYQDQHFNAPLNFVQFLEKNFKHE